VTVWSAKLQIVRVNDLITRARALIFDVDGTLAETEETHRQAFNEAFVKMGMNWCWGRTIYKKLLRVAGGKERIRAFDRMRGTGSKMSEAEIAKLHRKCRVTWHVAELGP
jgi:beta-phosphoglucomutase-like phosphatase (HAD superfamily)